MVEKEAAFWPREIVIPGQQILTKVSESRGNGGAREMYDRRGEKKGIGSADQSNYSRWKKA